jgi:hypothetical protein
MDEDARAGPLQKEAEGTSILPITDDIESLGAIFVDPSAYSDPRLWHEKAARIRAGSPILKVSVDAKGIFLSADRG